MCFESMQNGFSGCSIRLASSNVSQILDIVLLVLAILKPPIAIQFPCIHDCQANFLLKGFR